MKHSFLDVILWSDIANTKSIIYYTLDMVKVSFQSVQFRMIFLTVKYKVEVNKWEACCTGT